MNHLKEIPDILLKWYDNHARILPWRESPTAYRVWISEIMLQQTRVEAVKPYFERFIKELPQVKDLALASEEQLVKLWEGLGYYNRVRNLQKAAQTIMNDYKGEIPDSYEKLLELSGIGEYTAGAIASIAFGKNVPAVDGNVLRVYTRITADKEDITKTAVKKEITKQIKNILPQERTGDFNQSLMELGATICLPNGLPKCEQCPLKNLCEAKRQNLIQQIPVKTPKKKRKIEKRIVFIFYCNGKLALKKRQETGLLAGMWEFPNIEVLSDKSIETILNEWDLKAISIFEMKPAKHIFTHIEWHMKGYFIEVSDINEQFCWFIPEEIQERIAIPSAFKAFWNQPLEKIKKGEKTNEF